MNTANQTFVFPDICPGDAPPVATPGAA
jgi:hypothetical protein